jgi:predicted O-methyltransferase YrrM
VIVNDRIISYIHSLEKSNTPLLEEMEKYAKEHNVPIIRKEVESFLRVMINIKKPKRILEIGSAIGYSAILMSECIDKDAKIITIENYEKRIDIAKANFANAEDKITLIEGDALIEIPKLNEKFDFVFMDAAKGQYINFLPEVMKVMKKDGVLISDNIFQEGDLIESRYAVTRRDRTIHHRMRDFLYTVKNMPELETTLIPLGDGLTMSVKL